MTRIRPERVVDAAAAIASVDLGARIKSALEKFLVLKTLGAVQALLAGTVSSVAAGLSHHERPRTDIGNRFRETATV